MAGASVATLDASHPRPMRTSGELAPTAKALRPGHPRWASPLRGAKPSPGSEEKGQEQSASSQADCSSRRRSRTKLGEEGGRGATKRSRGSCKGAASPPWLVNRRGEQKERRVKREGDEPLHELGASSAPDHTRGVEPPWCTSPAPPVSQRSSDRGGCARSQERAWPAPHAFAGRGAREDPGASPEQRPPPDAAPALLQALRGGGSGRGGAGALRLDGADALAAAAHGRRCVRRGGAGAGAGRYHLHLRRGARTACGWGGGSAGLRAHTPSLSGAKTLGPRSRGGSTNPVGALNDTDACAQPRKHPTHATCLKDRACALGISEHACAGLSAPWLDIDQMWHEQLARDGLVSISCVSMSGVSTNCWPMLAKFGKGWSTSGRFCPDEPNREYLCQYALSFSTLDWLT